MPENEARWRTHRSVEKCSLIKKKVSTAGLTKKTYKISNTLQDSLHIFNMYHRYWEVKKKLTVSWFGFLIYFLQYLQHITLVCKTSKLIKELAEFINDLSVTCLINLYRAISRQIKIKNT